MAETPIKTEELHVVARTSFLSKWDWGIGVVFLGVLLATSALLFFSKGGAVLFNDVSRSEHVIRDAGTLTIAYDQPLETYEPTASGVVNRGYLANVYEPLVRFDRDFNLEPSLALSWGRLDEETWEFKLRPDVVFHDGSPFTADDVVASLERAQLHPDSENAPLLASLDSVEATDDYTVRLITSQPDPTLLQKLTMVWIVPEALGETVPTPIGTGPYSFVRQVNGDTWQFERFDAYWGEAPSYPELTLLWVADKFARYESFLSGDIDVLAQVPPVFVDALLQMEYPIASLPTLEVNFLLFGWDDQEDGFLRQDAVREAIVHAFNPDDLVEMTSGFATPTGQFVSRGVWGYDPDIEPFEYDLEYATDLIDSTRREVGVTLDLPEGMESFGEYVVNQLALIGVTVEVHYWEAAAYSDLIESGESEFFFLAWRSELGDSGDFFTNLVHSGEGREDYGRLNGGRYANAAVDDSIERMDQNVLEFSRLEQLQDLMRFVVQEEFIGVPLFETNSLVAIQPELQWNPRLDGLLLASDFE